MHGFNIQFSMFEKRSTHLRQQLCSLGAKHFNGRLLNSYCDRQKMVCREDSQEQERNVKFSLACCTSIIHAYLGSLNTLKLFNYVQTETIKVVAFRRKTTLLIDYMANDTVSFRRAVESRQSHNTVASDDVPEIDAAIFRGRRIYQELPAPAINHINGRDNTALRTALINNTFRKEENVNGRRAFRSQPFVTGCITPSSSLSTSFYFQDDRRLGGEGRGGMRGSA
ncbi:hypothetical protein C0J52_24828 [Blattella germanica]|nr:hypothetical protein C0J52_24828 [Blattella germanica]